MKTRQYIILSVIAASVVVASPANAAQDENASAALTPVKLIASDAAAGDAFGSWVRLEDNTIVVGAPGDDDNGPDSGSAYVFVRNGNLWQQQAKLTASDGAPGDQFGVGIAIHGDLVVVGARSDNDNGTKSGSAYVFARQNGIWSQQAKVVPNDGAANDRFGSGVLIADDFILIGASQDDVGGVGNAGSVYEFARDGNAWVQQCKIVASDRAPNDSFGGYFALSGETLFISAPQDDDNGTESGSVYVFTRENGSWTFQSKLVATGGAPGEYFGADIAAYEDTLVVGAYNYHDVGFKSGSAYVFTGQGGTWAQQAKLVASDGSPLAAFGRGAAIEGETIVLAAPYEDNENGTDAGSFYIFTGSGSTWTEQEKFVPSDGAAGDLFGSLVDISGGTIVAGAPFSDGAGQDAGAVYVYTSNQLPVVDAGGPYAGDEGSAIPLVGANASDSDSDPLTYNWAVDSPLCAFDDAALLNPSLTCTDDGGFTVTLTVDDGVNDPVSDQATVTVANVAPVVDAGPDQTVYRGDPVMVAGTWSDPAGSVDEPYLWSWDLDGDSLPDSSGSASYGDTIDETTSFALEGLYTLTFAVTDKDGDPGSDTLVVEVLNRPPVCSAASPSVETLWPPNHQFVAVNVLGVADEEDDPITITIDSIFQDEPVDAPGSGNTSPDGQGVGMATAEVRAERVGSGNGRYYHIGFTADDGHGGTCSGEVLVGVPKSQGKKGAPVDDGALYDSTIVVP